MAGEEGFREMGVGRCAICGTEWREALLVCPFCGEEHPVRIVVVSEGSRGGWFAVVTGRRQEEARRTYENTR